MPDNDFPPPSPSDSNSVHNDPPDPHSLDNPEATEDEAADEIPPRSHDPELGTFDDHGLEAEPKLRELKNAHDYIKLLQNASLDDSNLEEWVRERLRHPLTEPIEDIMDPTLRLSIDIFLAVSNASQETYNAVRNALVRYNPEDQILSYDAVKRRIAEISGIIPLREDMCINTCLAFTGPFSKFDACPECGEARYDGKKSRPGKKVARRQFDTFPIGPLLQALWRSPENARQMQYRVEKTAKVLETLEATGSIPVYDDFCHGTDYIAAVRAGKITEDDMVLLFSIDGAQLYKNKHSDCWFAIWIILDRTPDSRYVKKSIFPAYFIPGPNNPKHADSFAFPSLHHLAALQKEGLHIWDGHRKRTFKSHPFLAFATADSPGMTHLSGLVGHQGKLGCRLYCEMQGRHKPGGTHYFPAARKPLNYTVTGCSHNDVDLNRSFTQSTNRYHQNLRFVLASSTETQFKNRRLNTGIVKPSLFSGLPEDRIFTIPGCFPLDLMHLISLNIPDLFFDLWRGKLYSEKEDDKTTWDWAVLHGDVWKTHGKLVASTTPYLPGSFDRAPRNPAEKISSGYKAWEFLLYMFVLGPAVFRAILPEKYWRHFCKLVFGIRILHQRRIMSQQLRQAHTALIAFVNEFELLYYQRKSSRLHFVRQSIHLLIHIAPETHRVGPLSLVTQWPLERTIGNLGQEVKQHSNPFANLSERGLQRSQINALKAMIPDLDQAKSLPRGSKDLGDGYVLLRAMDQTFRHPRQCESVAIRHFLMAAGLDISPEFTISI